MAGAHVPPPMVRSSAVRVPSSEAEATRRLLVANDVLRTDLKVSQDGDAVVFPVSGDANGLPVSEHDFEARTERLGRYQDHLPEALRDKAPRAHDRFGDIVVVKVPDELSDHAHEIGQAIMSFHSGCRAVFHDKGVVGDFRTRDLELIAGEGNSETTVAEHGARLVVDPAKAYFSPRLSDERARIAMMLEPGERLIDMFGGVGALAVHAARTGTEVETIDLNPAACRMARHNIARNGVQGQVTVHEGDARDVALMLAPAHHVNMNLPHGAWDFLDTAVHLVLPGGQLHYHEILDEKKIDKRGEELLKHLKKLGREATPAGMRHVRTYSTGVEHMVFDVVLD